MLGCFEFVIMVCSIELEKPSVLITTSLFSLRQNKPVMDKKFLFMVSASFLSLMIDLSFSIKIIFELD